MTLISRIDPTSVRRILFLRPRFLGDICLTLPALDAARAACPRARVAYVVERESAPLLSADPRVDETVVISRGPGVGEALALIHRLRSYAPDVAVDLFCNPRTAFWTWISGAGVRVGYPHKGWRSRFYTHHAEPRTLSAVGFHLASIAALGWPTPHGIPRLHLAERAHAEANAYLTAEGIADTLRVGFHPGARWETRRWHAQRFVALARRFLEVHPDGMALVTGAAAEKPLVDTIVGQLPMGRARAVLGWPIDRLVGLQACCRAFVSGDTGPLHTAVAAGTPTLGLMSRNLPAMFFPYPKTLGHRAYYARAECSPCHRDRCSDLRCLERLTVEGAWRILSEMLGQDTSERARRL